MYEEYHNDKNLVRDIRKRNPDAFAYLRLKCYDAIRLMIVKMGGDEAHTEDLYNDNITNLIKWIDQPTRKITTRVTTILIDLCKKQLIVELNKQQAAGRYLEENNSHTYEEDFEKQMDEALYKKVLWTSFRKLNKDCKKILKEFYEGKELKEIAASMGFTYQYVRKKKVQCFRKLLAQVQNHQDYRQLKHESR